MKRIFFLLFTAIAFISCNSPKSKEEKMIEEQVKDSILNEEIDNLIKDLETNLFENDAETE